MGEERRHGARVLTRLPLYLSAAFAVVPADEKYKAKPIIDVFLYRGGDVAGAGIDGLLRSLGTSLSFVALATVPFAIAWTGLSLGMGKAQARRDPGSPDADEPTT